MFFGGGGGGGNSTATGTTEEDDEDDGDDHHGRNATSWWFDDGDVDDYDDRRTTTTTTISSSSQSKRRAARTGTATTTSSSAAVYPAGISSIPQSIVSSVTRVGIVPYCYEDDGSTSDTAAWFAFAVDAKFGELTDCGGRRKQQPHESLVHTAARELYEESLRIFDFRSNLDQIASSPAIANSRTCIFFVRVDGYEYGFPDELPVQFARRAVIEPHTTTTPTTTTSHTRRRSSYYHFSQRRRTGGSGSGSSFMENSTMYWISQHTILELIKSKTRGSAIRKFHKSCVQITSATFQPQTTSVLAAAAASAAAASVDSTPPSGDVDNNFSLGQYFHPRMYENVRRLMISSFGSLLQYL
jgi:hypothetical protein